MTIAAPPIETTKLPAPPKITWEQHLINQGYQKNATPDILTGREFWQRRTRFSAPPCKVNGKQSINVYVERREGENPHVRFEMEVIGSNGRFWSTITAAVESEDLLIKSSGEIEHRLMDAWREMS